MHSAMAEATEQDVTVETRHDKEALEFDVTHCRFAEFFRALGEPELGALLICETDFDIAAAGGGEVAFTRDQTIMQGELHVPLQVRPAMRETGRLSPDCAPLQPATLAWGSLFDWLHSRASILHAVLAAAP
jgi:hypothetical protein